MDKKSLLRCVDSWFGNFSRPKIFVRRTALALLVCAAHVFFAGNAAAAAQTDLPGPTGSGQFGTSVTVLPNGNIVVTDPFYDAPGPIADVGAVYLYNAAGGLISTLTGSVPNDRVGYYGVMVLTNGNYVVRSPLWHNGAAADAGAATWCSGSTGCSGTVSVANSLVGTSVGDRISNNTFALSNGHYITQSGFWDNGAATDAGAVTWGNGTTGRTGVVSSANSLVGTRAGDDVGGGGTRVLPNGNYVTNSPNWDNGATVDAGASTWCDGTTGCAGPVSTANSLFGATANDRVGSASPTVLTNGNYVVRSRYWSNGPVLTAGAATWCNGATGRIGAVSPSNSLVGTKTDDFVGGAVTALTNGNYVVRSTEWDNAAATNAGAVTWCDGTVGRTGAVSTSNSLVGEREQDRVGSNGVAALSNGNYVVNSPGWNGGYGAATWCNGTAGCTGGLSFSNSLIGLTDGDEVGAGTTALTNGNYVVRSPNWNNGAAVDAGAATWCDGTTGRTGVVSAGNSLVGSTANDHVGAQVTALTNGNYVVSSQLWDNGATPDAGAATWCNGAVGRTGAVSTSNSLVGTTSGDQVGDYGIVALTGGDYVVSSASWGNTDRGAVTWCSGIAGRIGTVSAANSLVGSTADDQVGYAIALPDGNYLVRSDLWDNGATVNAGAITLGRDNTAIIGVIDASNSVRAAAANFGFALFPGYNAFTGQLVVGRPGENIVSLFTYRGPTFTVTTTDDHNDGACTVGDCTLREAIVAANALPDDNKINFAPGLSGTIQLALALPSLTSNINLEGPGPNLLTVRRNSGGDYRIFTISNGTSSGPRVFISGLTISNGQAPFLTFPNNSGGGILNDRGGLVVRDCVLTGNRSFPSDLDAGGGILNYHGSLSVTASTLSGNIAQFGGGVANSRTTPGSAQILIRSSTLSGNTASGGYGGAFYSQASNAGTTEAALINCTLSGNTATVNGFLGGTGGAIYHGCSFSAGNTANLALEDCTISGNASPSGSGIYNTGSGASASITMRNTLLKTGASGVNIINAGIFTSLGHNLSNDAAAGFGGTGPGGYLDGSGDIRNTDPLLGPLQNNGGPTQTHALLAGSPAINTGENTGESNFDQRGFPRVSANDIGAFEFGSASPAPAVVGAVSRKLHGGIPFDINLPLTGNSGVECRSGGANNDYQVIFTFPSSVTFNSAAVSSGAGSVSSSSGSGTTTVTVNLTGVTSGQRITVTLSNVSDGTNTGDVGVPMGVLIGDTNGSGSVSNSDVSQTKAQSGNAVTAANFREDVNTDGAISNSDVSLVKSKSGTQLPP